MLKLILIAGALQGLLLGLMLLNRKNNQKANRIFTILLFLLAGHIVLVAFDKRSFFMRFPHFSHLTWLIPLLYGPLILLYVRRITALSPSFQKKELLYFIPFLVWLVVQLPYYLQSATYKRAYLDNYALSVKDDFGLLNQLTNFVHLFFFSLCIYVYHQHRERILTYYSDLKKVRMAWLQQFLYAALAIIIISIFVFYARKFEWPYLSKLYPFHFLGIVLVIYWTGYKAMAQPALFGNFQQYSDFEDVHQNSPIHLVLTTSENHEEKPQTEKKVALDEATRESIAHRLEELMHEDKWYLKSELTIQDLAEKLQTNRQYISEVLNGYFGKNFYDYINDYRCEAFKALVTNPEFQHLKILALAYEAGFNSKATFNAVFKKKNGITPSEYAKQTRVLAEA